MRVSALLFSGYYASKAQNSACETEQTLSIISVLTEEQATSYKLQARVIECGVGIPARD